MYYSNSSPYIILLFLTSKRTEPPLNTTSNPHSWHGKNWIQQDSRKTFLFLLQQELNLKLFWRLPVSGGKILFISPAITLFRWIQTLMPLIKGASHAIKTSRNIQSGNFRKRGKFCRVYRNFRKFSARIAVHLNFLPEFQEFSVKWKAPFMDQLWLLDKKSSGFYVFVRGR